MTCSDDDLLRLRCRRRPSSVDRLRIDELDLVVRLEVLDDTLGDEQERADETERKQHPERAADQVDPEVAERRLLALRDAADERDRQRDPDRRRHEVVVREPRHLRQVAHRRLGDVGLPVRVRRERRRGVEREVGRDGAERLRVEGQRGLEPLHQVEHDHRDDAEEHERDRVLGPAHLVLLVDARQAVDEPLDRTEHGIEPRALAREHARHERPERLGDREDREKVYVI